MTLHLFFSHSLTADQIEDAKNSLGVSDFVQLEDDLQNLWSNVPPQIENLNDFLEPFKKYLKTASNKGDYVLISGDFGATCQMAQWAKQNDLVPVYATTQRNVIENVGEDGQIVKKSVFRHMRFRGF